MSKARHTAKTAEQDQELARLLAVADRIQAADAPTLSKATRDKIKNIPRHGRPAWVPVAGFSFAGAMAVFAVLVLAAQNASPSSPLYALRQGTDYVRALVQPGYKDDLVDIRKDEIKALEETGATDIEIMDAEDAYLDALEKSSEEKRTTEQQSGDADAYTEKRSWYEDSRDEETENTTRDSWKNWRNSRDNDSDGSRWHR